jgi:hypothetical protein
VTASTLQAEEPSLLIDTQSEHKYRVKLDSSLTRERKEERRRREEENSKKSKSRKARKQSR